MANKKPLKGKFPHCSNTPPDVISRLDLIKQIHRRLYAERVSKDSPPPEHIYREDICFSCGGSFLRDVDELGLVKFPRCPICLKLEKMILSEMARNLCTSNYSSKRSRLSKVEGSQRHYNRILKFFDPSYPIQGEVSTEYLRSFTWIEVLDICLGYKFIREVSEKILREQDNLKSERRYSGLSFDR